MDKLLFHIFLPLGRFYFSTITLFSLSPSFALGKNPSFGKRSIGFSFFSRVHNLQRKLPSSLFLKAPWRKWLILLPLPMPTRKEIPPPPTLTHSSKLRPLPSPVSKSGAESVLSSKPACRAGFPPLPPRRYGLPSPPTLLLQQIQRTFSTTPTRDGRLLQGTTLSSPPSAKFLSPSFFGAQEGFLFLAVDGNFLRRGCVPSPFPLSPPPPPPLCGSSA